MKIDFNSFFTEIYKERWANIFSALQYKEKQVARKNNFINSTSQIFSSATVCKESILGNCFWMDNQSVSPTRTEEGLLDYYILDPGSVMIARQLDVKPGDKVLDMCAAPGGKTLVLLESLQENGELIANDMSDKRRERLTKVIQNYVPRDVRNRIWVTGKDAVQFGLKNPGDFDKVLLDAPCSGERHMVESSLINDWSAAKSKSLAHRQYSLLSAALLALKEGGIIVYSTCSLSPYENDDVIAKLLKKKGDQVELLPVDDFGFGEKTQFGVQFLPDKCGFGPLFFVKIKKI